MTRQDQFLTTVECSEAHRLFRSHLNLCPLGTEVVTTDRILGRVLSSPVIARTSVPGFDRSNFDGFAIQSRDVIGATENQPVTLQLIGHQIPAGHQPDFEVQTGQAVSIATGGMVPRGANAICLVEHTDFTGQKSHGRLQAPEESSQVTIFRSVYPGSGISFAGTDIASGETVLRAGQMMSSRETGVLAAIGETSAEVYRRPKVAVISTGNEIIAPGQDLRPGLVYDSNARIIADAVREVGGTPIELGIAIDDLEKLEEYVEKALDLADMVLLSGGTSKGEGDLSYRVVSQFQDPGILAHGVALKPGKPICLAVTGQKPLAVLPGFPTSAIFTFHEFIAPIIRIMAGRNHEENKMTRQAQLAAPINSEIGRTEFLLVGLMNEDANPKTKSGLRAYPMGKGSGSVTTFSRADGFITIDRHTEILEAGQKVEVQLIGDRHREADLVVMGSHCQMLDQLLNEVQRCGVFVKFFAVGSMGGLLAAKNEDCDIAGIHLLDPETGTYNSPFATDEVVIQRGYPRTQGIVFRQDDRRLDPFFQQAPKDLVVSLASNPDLLMINRNKGSGTRVLIDRVLEATKQNRPPGYEIQATNHHAVCAAVQHRRADWGIAIQTVAAQHHLGFVPLENEQFDFAIPKSRLPSDAVQQFLRILRDHADISND